MRSSTSLLIQKTARKRFKAALELSIVLLCARDDEGSFNGCNGSLRPNACFIRRSSRFFGKFCKLIDPKAERVLYVISHRFRRTCATQSFEQTCLCSSFIEII